jgi:hypothetical protein
MERASNALHIEAQDMLLAVFVASEMGCENVLFETDSDVLKQAATTEEVDMSMLGTIFRNSKFNLPWFQRCTRRELPRHVSVGTILTVHILLMEAGHSTSSQML